MFRFDENAKKILITVMIFMLFSSIMSGIGSFDLMSTLLMLPGLILALTVHELSHAKMADRLGDPTPERQGRLTLNPLAHMDIMGTICLLTAGFGWGKPVQIDPTYFRNPSRDNMLVALAGPVSNFILAFISFLSYGFLYYLLPDVTWAGILLMMIILSAYINLSLGVFNLLPFPPLDGSKILVYFLKGKAKTIIWTLEKYSYIVIALMFFTSIPAKIVSPISDWIGNGMVRICEMIINLFV